MSSRPQERSPYQGLIPYGEDDAPFFFGREKETRLITANLFASSLTLLYGASGVGKSSVLRAGVAHQLRQRDDLLVVVFNSWQRDPVNDLKAKISTIAALVDSTITPPSVSISLADYLTTYAQKLDRRLMIILDQFEEYFLYHAQDDTFAAEFATALLKTDTSSSFLISIREDFYAKLDRFEGRIPALYDNYFRIEHLDRKAARAALEKPIAEFNRLHNGNATSMSLEPALVEAVLKQVETGQVVIGEAGRGTVGSTKPQEDAHARIETPFLQLVMTRLWDEEMRARSTTLRLATLERLGGAESIVRTHLDAVMSAQQPQDQDVASGIFHYLVTPSGTKIAYTASDLAQQAELNKDQVVRVLEKLSHGDLRILRPVDPPLDQPSAPRYEIFHDVLAPAVISWCGAYLQAKRNAEAEQRAREQEQRANEQARVARRLRLLVAAMTVMVLLALSSAIYAFTLRREAQSKSVELQNKAIELEKARASAVLEQGRAKQEAERADGQARLAHSREADAIKANEKTKTALDAVRKEKQRADERESEAVAARTKADESRSVAEKQQAIAQSRELAASGLGQLPFDLELGVLLARKAAEVSPTLEAEQVLRRALLESHQRAVLSHDSDAVQSAALSPDGKDLVTGTEKTARIWDAKTFQRVAELPELIAPVKRISFSPDGRFVVATETVGEKDDETAQVWQAGTWRSLAVPPGPNQHLIEVFSPDNGRVVVIGTNLGSRRGRTYSVRLKTATVYETDKRKAIAELKGHTLSITSAAFTPDSKYILTKSDDRTARVWEASTGRPMATFKDVWTADLIGNGKYVLTDDGTKVVAWETSTGRKVNERPGPYSFVGEGRNGDDKIILVQKERTPENETIVLTWQVSTGKTVSTKGQMIGDLREAIISPDGKVVLLAGDYDAWVWDTKDNSNSMFELQRGERLSNIAFSPDSRLVLAVSGGNNVQVWETGSRIAKGVGEPLKHLDKVDSAVFSPNSRLIVTASADVARVWDVVSSKEVAEFRGHSGPINGVTFSADSRSVVTTSDDHTARVWEVGMSQSLFDLREQSAEIYGYVFRSDGKLILTGSNDNTVQQWEVSTGHATPKQPGPPGMFRTFTLSPDGQRVIMASDDSAVRGWDSRTGRNLSVLRGHTKYVRNMAITREGRYLVTASDDGTARVWDTATGVAMNVLNSRPGQISSVGLSADGKSIVTVNDQSVVQVWDTVTGEKRATLSAEAQKNFVDAAVLSPDGRFVITVNDYDAILWDLTTATVHGKIVDKPTMVLHDPANKVTDKPVWTAAFSPDGKAALVSGGEGVQVWQVEPVRPLVVLEGHAARASRAEFSPDGKLILTAGSQNSVGLWDAGTGKFVRQLSGHTRAVLSASFSPDGQFIVTASDDRTARVWETNTGRALAVMEGHSGKVTDAVFSSDGKHILTMSGVLHGSHLIRNDDVSDNTSRVWEAGTGHNLVVLRGGLAVVSPDGSTVVTAGESDALWISETRTGKVIAELHGQHAKVTSTAFSPDGKLVAAGNLDGSAGVWEAETGRLVASLTGQLGEVTSLAFSPDSTLIATSSGYLYKPDRADDSDYTARIWEVRTGRNVAVMQGHTGRLFNVSFSPDGRYVVTTSRDNTARVWETSTGRAVAVLSKHTAPVTWAAFSHDGKYIVTASEDRTARVWALTGALISELLGHRDEVHSATFSSDDKFVVTASKDQTARVWEASTGQIIAELLGHHGNDVKSAVFSPDNKFVITWTGYPDSAARVFACEVCGSVEELKKLASEKVKRELTPDEKEKYLHLPRKR